MNMKQVDKSHYEFSTYMSKARWNSVWHQLNEVLKLKPGNVLEIGPGPGVFKRTADIFGVKVETLDLDPELRPDHLGSATSLPFQDNSYDVCCAFQMLEHMPYEESLKAFSEMVRVSKSSIVISLPDAKPTLRYGFSIPKLGFFGGVVSRPFARVKKHVFDGEHYWEVNKKKFALSRIVKDFGAYAQLVDSWRVYENPYHRFFIFRKKL